MATIEDVAKHAGVSIATVSRVLNGSPRVDAGRVERVRAAIEALDYHPSRAARTLRANRSRIIGLLISDIQNPFFTALARGVEDVAQSNGHSLILCNSDEDPLKEQQYLGVLCEEQVAGVILAPTRARQPALRQCHQRGIPVVAVDRRVQDKDVDTVIVNNVQGADDAVTHLITNGYRRIGIIVGPMSLSTASERLEGYRRALSRAGIPFDPAIVRQGAIKQPGGRLLTAELLDAGPPIDALFATNNLTTLGALEALHARGVRVPDDIGMVGFDEMPWAALSGVSLTTVAQPVYDLGSTAATRLFQRLGNPTAFTRQEIVLAPSLYVRGSSRLRSTVSNLLHTGAGAGSL